MFLKNCTQTLDHQIETSKRPATEVRQSLLLSTAQTHHPIRILALLDLSPRWWVLFLPPFFISTGHKRQRWEVPQRKLSTSRAHQGRTRATTAKDEARTGASPAIPERKVLRRRRSDTREGPRVSWARDSRVHGAGPDRRLHSLGGGGWAGVREEGKGVVLPDVHGFSFIPKFLELQGAPPRSPRTF